MEINSKLVAIVGPTASGKSVVAMELAQKFDGEIVCADARTIYKGMDIGTAKPSVQDQQKVRHHLLDIVTLDQRFTAAEFQRLAKQAIADINARGKLPILVGGTGLYVDSVLFDFDFRPTADPALRQELENLSVEELQRRITDMGLELPNNSHNPRHLIRTIETNGAISSRKGLPASVLMIGLEVSEEELKDRIQSRTQNMLAAGLKQEVETLAKTYGWEAPGISAIGYKEWRALLENNSADEAEVTAEINRNSWQYARRQKTWFKRNKSIQWLSDPSKAVDIATTFLNKTLS